MYTTAPQELTIHRRDAFRSCTLEFFVEKTPLPSPATSRAGRAGRPLACPGATREPEAAPSFAASWPWSSRAFARTSGRPPACSQRGGANKKRQRYLKTARHPEKGCNNYSYTYARNDCRGLQTSEAFYGIARKKVPSFPAVGVLSFELRAEPEHAKTTGCRRKAFFPPCVPDMYQILAEPRVTAYLCSCQPPLELPD